MNNNHWLEEQLNQDRRRSLEQHAEEARARQTDNKQTAWEWLQKRIR